jgi:hypothetical protein
MDWYSLHCFSGGSFSPMTPSDRLNVGSQKEEAPGSLADVPIDGIAFGILDHFPATRIWFRLYSQGFGSESARPHHDGANFYGS